MAKLRRNTAKLRHTTDKLRRIEEAQGPAAVSDERHTTKQQRFAVDPSTPKESHVSPAFLLSQLTTFVSILLDT